MNQDRRVFTKKQDIVYRHIAGEPLLVPIRGKLADMQRIFSLNPVAAFIWELINGAHTVGDIHGEVVAAFDVSVEKAAADIDEFIAGLLDAELIVEVD